MKKVVFIIFITNMFFSLYGEAKSDYSMGFSIPKSSEKAVYNIPSRIQVDKNIGLFTTCSFIYWCPFEEGLEIGYNTKLAVELPIIQFDIEAIKNMEYKYSPGFKVGLGKKFNMDDWNIYANYTWLHIKNSKTVNTIYPGALLFIIPWFHNNMLPESINQVTGSWKLNYDVVELMLQRPFYLGRCLSMDASCGLRGLVINQNYYSLVNLYGTSSNTKSHSWGIGPYCVVDFNWLFVKNFKAVFRPSAGLYFQHFKNKCNFE